MKYDVYDLETLSVAELCVKYNATPNAIRRMKSYHQIYERKIRIRIITPYRIIVVKSIQECCETLELSRTTIKRALKGEKVPILVEMGITLEVLNNGEKERIN